MWTRGKTSKGKTISETSIAVISQCPIPVGAGFLAEIQTDDG
jgi:hypothetical protein